MELPKTHEEVVDKQKELQQEYYSLHKKIVADYEKRLKKWEDEATKSINRMLKTASMAEPTSEETIAEAGKAEEDLANAATVTVGNSEIISNLVNSAAFQEVMAAAVKSAVNEILRAVKKKDPE